MPRRTPPPPERLRLADLLGRVRRVRVALVGDFALDACWFLDPRRSARSLETGLPTRPIRVQEYHPGAAGNIAANLRALGARVHALGVVGRDPWGAELVAQLRRAGVDTRAMVEQGPGWATPVFVKPFLDGREGPRFDTADYNRLSAGSMRALFRALEGLLPRVDVVVVNQQVRDSLHCAAFRRRMARWIRLHRNRLVIADTRDYGASYRTATLKLNEHEAVRMVSGRPLRTVPLRLARRAALAIHRASDRPVFVTRGHRGCLVADGTGVREVPAVRVPGRVDTVGAGDSLLSGITLALGAGLDAVSAASFGSLVASITVRKLNRTGTAAPREVLRAGRRFR